jgi:predicted MFS family arabinose efflux permease
VAGLFGLVGVIGATIAPRVGRLADRTRRPRLTIGLGLFLVLLAFALFWLLRFELWGLIVGVILLDLGVQMNLTSCQAIVQSLNATARSRLNTIFMTAYFIGGALGSALGSSGWSAGRWPAVCTSGALLIILALLIFLLSAKNRRRQAKLART